jgi:hypothetical protein
MHQCQHENLAGHRHALAPLAPSSQGSRPYSRSVQPHRFGYLLEVTGVGRS